MFHFDPLSSVKCTLPIKTTILVVFSTLALGTLHRVYTKLKWCLICKAWIIHGKGNSCRRPWTGKPCWVVKHPLDSMPDMGDKIVCSLSLPSVFTSPQNQSSRPLSLWASPDCPSKKLFLLLGGHFCPWEQTPTSRTWGKGIPALHSFHISFIMLLSQIYFPVVSSPWKLKQEQRGSWFYHSLTILSYSYTFWKHIFKESLFNDLSNPYTDHMLSWKYIVFTRRMLRKSCLANKHVIYHWLSWYWALMVQQKLFLW